jgi:translation initiation factor 1
MAKPKKRIDTNADQTQRPLIGLNSALSGINLPVIPSATEEEPNDLQGTANPEPLWKLGRVVLRKERAHRNGKTVIVVYDFATHLPISVIEKTAKKLRAACGCGGTVKDRIIEIQGDQPDKIRSILEAEGYEVAGIK